MRLRVGPTTRPLLHAQFLIPCGAIRVPFPFNEFLVASYENDDDGAVGVGASAQRHERGGERIPRALSYTSRRVR